MEDGDAISSVVDDKEEEKGDFRQSSSPRSTLAFSTFLDSLVSKIHLNFKLKNHICPVVDDKEEEKGDFRQS